MQRHPRSSHQRATCRETGPRGSDRRSLEKDLPQGRHLASDRPVCTIANGETGRQNVPRDFDRHHRDTDLLKLRGRSESGLTRTQVRQEEEIRR